MGLLRDYMSHLYKTGEQAQLGQQKLDQIQTEYENKGSLAYSEAQYKQGQEQQRHENKLTEDTAKAILDTGLEGTKSVLRQQEQANKQALDVATRKETYWYDLGEDTVKGLFGLGSAAIKGALGKGKGSGLPSSYYTGL